MTNPREPTVHTPQIDLSQIADGIGDQEALEASSEEEAIEESIEELELEIENELEAEENSEIETMRAAETEDTGDDSLTDEQVLEGACLGGNPIACAILDESSQADRDDDENDDHN